MEVEVELKLGRGGCLWLGLLLPLAELELTALVLALVLSLWRPLGPRGPRGAGGSRPGLSFCSHLRLKGILKREHLLHWIHGFSRSFGSRE